MAIATTGKTKSDTTLQQQVLQELRWDQRVNAADIGVSTHRGVVTLTGTVGSYAEYRAAQEASHRVEGVLDVANDLKVKYATGGARTDTDIAQAIRRALEWDVVIPHEKIQTTVANGWVTLEGSVNYGYQKDHAERAVRNLAGVHGVINRVTVAAPSVDPSVIKSEIEQALERRAEREAKRIDVAVAGGTVKITGKVRSWAEKQAVLGAARATRGVHSVDDHLEIDPYA